MRRKVFLWGLLLLVALAAAGIWWTGWHDKPAALGPENRPARNESRAVLLRSFFGNPQDYAEAFAGLDNSVGYPVRAGIVPHHFLAKRLIAEFFAGLGNTNAKTVIMIGPDHFQSLQGKNVLAATSLLGWETPFGVVDADHDLGERLIAEPGVMEDNPLFFAEHSIYTEVPFLKKVLPNANIIPLIISREATAEKYVAFGQRLRELAGDEVLLVVSSDFSHNLSVADAQRSDQKSMAVLQSLDSQNAAQVGCDCPACMGVLSGFLGKSKHTFRLLRNQSSNDFGSQDKTVTSYVSGYFEK
ncbi:AmmeMemoRadiSam system protein B [Patescibacteria group bacterium]|nr:MAG: AmmeMemoRadiSam system protein B [Patescibacteria group bacterium]